MQTVYKHRPSFPFVAGQEPAGIVAEHQKSMYFRHDGTLVEISGATLYSRE
jgi:hypothetical protein